jgi:N6-adenosine-specific RNA methylase IME4
MKEKKKYQIIYADPPWLYDNGGNQKSRGMARGSFPCMPIEDIKNMRVPDITADDAMIFLWVTMPKLREGLSVIEAWGFKYITCAFVWVKQNPRGEGIYSGLGHWVNGNAELCLLGRKGKTLERKNKAIKQIVLSPRGRHSAKPVEVRNRIVALLGDLPRIELFARQKTEGWDTWGNEVESDIKLSQLEEKKKC